jgi:glyoxylase-like metal-dependent hydrolase (beta-lactamase superfamily II)
LWHRRAGWLIAGDMVASVGTIIVDPDDDGDMQEYIRQLARLAELSLQCLLPAHGAPIDAPQDHLKFYIAHRRERELKVLSAVPAKGDGADLPSIVKDAYADTPPWLWPLASKSARAHLRKLEREGRVTAARQRWVREN